MKVHLIKKQTIEDYVVNHARSRSSFTLWLTALKNADWNEPGDMAKTFGAADLLGNGTNRVVFDIGGNNFRMICKYAFGDKAVHLFICWIGTHAEYDKLCNKNEQYTVNMY
jgi:mRNA interferase HigB